MAAQDAMLAANPVQQGRSKADVVALVSHKGGSGKTVFCANLGYLLQDVGRSVLYIDTDYATAGLSLFLLDASVNTHVDLEPENCLFDSYRSYLETARPGDSDGSGPSAMSGAQTTPLPEPLPTPFVYRDPDLKKDLHIITPNRAVLKTKSFRTTPRGGADSACVPAITDGQAYRAFLETIIAHFRPRFDHIIIDTRGGYGISALAAISVSDHYLLVSEPDHVSVDQLRKFLRCLSQPRQQDDAWDMGQLGAIVLNKSIDPESDRLGVAPALEIEASISHPNTLIFVIPLDETVVAAYRKTEFLLERYPHAAMATVLTDIVGTVLNPRTNWSDYTKSDPAENTVRFKARKQRLGKLRKRENNFERRWRWFGWLLLVALLGAIGFHLAGGMVASDSSWRLEFGSWARWLLYGLFVGCAYMLTAQYQQHFRRPFHRGAHGGTLRQNTWRLLGPGGISIGVFLLAAGFGWLDWRYQDNLQASMQENLARLEAEKAATEDSLSDEMKNNAKLESDIKTEQSRLRSMKNKEKLLTQERDAALERAADLDKRLQTSELQLIEKNDGFNNLQGKHRENLAALETEQRRLAQAAADLEQEIRQRVSAEKALEFELAKDAPEQDIISQLDNANRALQESEGELAAKQEELAVLRTSSPEAHNETAQRSHEAEITRLEVNVLELTEKRDAQRQTVQGLVRARERWLRFEANTIYGTPGELEGFIDRACKADDLVWCTRLIEVAYVAGFPELARDSYREMRTLRCPAETKEQGSNCNDKFQFGPEFVYAAALYFDDGDQSTFKAIEKEFLEAQNRFREGLGPVPLLIQRRINDAFKVVGRAWTGAIPPAAFKDWDHFQDQVRKGYSNR